MNIKPLCALILLLVASSTFAVEPGELECRNAAGAVTVRDIDQAHAAGGGIVVHFQFATGRSFTTEACLVNLGPATFCPKETDEVLIECKDPLGLIVYHAPAETWSVESGVLTWVEVEPSREQYLSTFACFVTSIDAQ
jgi:hypothetical protein